MFTGLIQEIGTIEKINSIPEGKEFVITCSKILPHLKVDDSVSVNGVCSTVFKLGPSSFSFHAIKTTLQKTTHQYLKAGQKVHLELAMTLQDRLGGHLVQGHVNGIGKVTKILKRGNSWKMEVGFPPELKPFVVLEGSICLDGVSLTISDLKGAKLSVSIIPHTLNQTHFLSKKVGSLINIEVDIIAKYVESLLRFSK
jgi:riboflavin synthase